jgi:hypothetical protein
MMRAAIIKKPAAPLEPIARAGLCCIGLSAGSLSLVRVSPLAVGWTIRKQT